MTNHQLSPRVKRLARALRANETPYEAKLWALLRDRRFAGYRFRRQVPVGPYIADFACYGRRLIVELDGSQHADRPTNAARDAELRRRGFRVLRIWNLEVTRNRNGVIEAIQAALQERTGLEADGERPGAD